MFLSQVVLEPRKVGTQRIISDLYRLHQFVYAAYSDRTGGAEHKPSILYRLETPQCTKPLVLLVQSEEEPDWAQCGGRHPGVIASTHSKEVSPAFHRGEVLRFRLCANPTEMAIRGKQEERKGYCRKGIFNEMGQREWLERVGKRCGFEASAVIISPRGTLEGRKPSSVPNDRTHVISCYMADFDGVLRISDVEQFETAYSQGVGRGKAWGCGLLSLGRA